MCNSLRLSGCACLQLCRQSPYYASLAYAVCTYFTTFPFNNGLVSDETSDFFVVLARRVRRSVATLLPLNEVSLENKALEERSRLSTSGCVPVTHPIQELYFVSNGVKCAGRLASCVYVVAAFSSTEMSRLSLSIPLGWEQTSGW